MSGESWNFGIRGGCDGFPLRLAGQYNGYNTAATEQVGLWIVNDAEHVELARAVTAASGAEALKAHLLGVMRAGHYTQAPHKAFDAAAASGGGIPCVDWAQIAFQLLGEDPTEEEVEQARAAARRQNLGITDSGAFKLAVVTRESRISRWLLEGVR